MGCSVCVLFMNLLEAVVVLRGRHSFNFENQEFVPSRVRLESIRSILVERPHVSTRSTGHIQRYC